MKIKTIETPIKIEREFNIIKFKINDYIHKKHKIPPNTLFKELDNEYEKILKKYEERKDQKNLLHVTHNYLWSKSFQFLSIDLTKSLNFITKAVSKLFKRHKLYPYAVDKFVNMLKAYKTPLIKINEKINNLKITYQSINESKDLLNSINSIEEMSSAAKISFLPSLFYGVLYSFRKKQLHFLVKFVYFEVSEKKQQDAQNIINQITGEMIEYSNKSLNYAKKCYKNKIPAEKNDEKRIITMKEIDILTADYYNKVYSQKDIIKSWYIMDKIKQFLVLKAFKENVHLTDNLLRYYDEEWSLLHVFTKICLLKEEVNKRKSYLRQDWEKDIFSKITSLLGNTENLFKYKMTNKRDYMLKIMTSSFAGVFSEYFIHELCREVFDYVPIDSKTNLEFKDLLRCIQTSENKDDIILNDVIEKDEPDIDIHIKNKCAIFLKNSKIESDEMKQIWKEINLCKRKRLNRIFYGINFIKNIEKIEYIRRSFENIKTHYPNFDIDIFDIKDLVSFFLNELKKIGKSKLNFSNLDIYRVLDY